MYPTSVALSIIFFNIIAVAFLSSSIIYITIERNILKGSTKVIDLFQFFIIISMYLTALSVFYFKGSYDNVVRTFTLFILGITVLKTTFYFTYKKGCPLMFNIVLFLFSTGIIFIYRLNPLSAISQGRFVFIGFTSIIILPLAFRFLPKLDKISIIYFLVGLALLLTPNIFNSSNIFGATNWVTIGPITFQPSEFVKFLFVFYLASFFSKGFSFKRLVFVTLFSGLYILILAYQRDFGGALVFFMTFMTLLYVRSGSILLFLTGILGASAFSYIAYTFMYHIQVRIAIWQNPWLTPFGDGRQIIQSLFAIGSYAPFGSGLTFGYPYYVSVIESDFIFAGIAEELGSIFALTIILLYIILFYRGINVALRSNSTFHSLLVVGFTSLLAFQSFLIIGGVTKLIPLTGVTLPFISYGGTSLVSSLFMIGIIQLIFVYNKNLDIENTDTVKSI